MRKIAIVLLFFANVVHGQDTGTPISLTKYLKDAKRIMDKFSETSLLIHSFQIKQTGSFSVCHHAIMSTNYAGKKTKPNNTLAIFMLQAFIINHPNIFFKYCP